jgi:hypothetical protein
MSWKARFLDDLKARAYNGLPIISRVHHMHGTGGVCEHWGRERSKFQRTLAAPAYLGHKATCGIENLDPIPLANPKPSYAITNDVVRFFYRSWAVEVAYRAD